MACGDSRWKRSSYPDVFIFVPIAQFFLLCIAHDNPSKMYIKILSDAEVTLLGRPESERINCRWRRPALYVCDETPRQKPDSGSELLIWLFSF
jgi:hypothetical protein